MLIWSIMEGSEYSAKIARGVTQACRVRGVDSRIGESVRGTLTELPTDADGFVAFISTPKIADTLAADGRPVVNVSGRLPPDRLPFPSVLPDNRGVGRMAAGHLIHEGHRSLAYLFYTFSGRFTRERRAGFREGAGGRISRLAIGTGPGFKRMGSVEIDRRIRAWLAVLPRPVGLGLPEDLLARRVLPLCHELGLEVPRDVAVIGTNNDDLLCESVDPPLTSIALNADRIGVEAAELLIRVLHGERPAERVVRVPPAGVVERSSTAATSSDPAVAAALHWMRARVAAQPGSHQIAAAVGVSRSTLERRFREQLGQSPASYMKRLRFRRACEMLTGTSQSLKQVAEACGFANSQHMANTFRKQTGQSPSDWRRQRRV